MGEPGPPTRCPRCGTESGDGRLGACPTCLLEDDLPSVLADTYELHEKVGEGGMGTVYRARHRRLDRIVALKFLNEPLAAQPDLHERLEAEGRAMARLDHPHIVAVHDLGRSLGHTYVVMEYVEGTPLSRLTPLPLKRTLELADQVCQALAYAHSRGVVHCDIKPQNILVDEHGAAKVTDFGIARVLGPLDLDDVVGPARVMGTRAYMAPETLRGAPPDPRMDVYALGVVLHEMATGRPPEPGQEPSGSLARILRKALCPDPDGRYANAAEMRRDLARVSASAERYLPEPNEVTRIRAAALLLSLIATVALQAFLGSLPFRLAAGPPWEQLLVLLIAAVAAAPILHALHRRWAQEVPGVAPFDYMPLDLDQVLSWSAAAFLAAATSWVADLAGLVAASKPAHLVTDLLALAALYRSLIVVLDLRRIGRGLGPHLAVVGLGLAPSLLPFFLKVLARLGQSAGH